MFTGLIEEVGRVASFDQSATRRRLTIRAKAATRELQVGDSISVNGVCLTAVEVSGDRFAADLAEETIRRTSLSRLAPGAPVNLELPARAGDRLGGHIVQGHIDGMGTLLSFSPLEGADDFWMVVQLPRELSRYVVEKGSIAIEGISLTVARVEAEQVHVAIIPHTRAATNLGALQPGDSVNIEVDVVAKYAEKFAREQTSVQSSSITIARLLAEGF